MEDLTSISAEEWADFYRRVLAENERRSRVAAAQEMVEVIVDQYAQDVAGAPAQGVDDIPVGGVVGPGGRILDADGVEWQNVSGAWLSPHTAGPAQYPLGWSRAGDSAVVDAPDGDGEAHAYQVGDLVSYGGVVYRVIQAHTSQAGWTPDQVPALYARA